MKLLSFKYHKGDEYPYVILVSGLRPGAGCVVCRDVINAGKVFKTQKILAATKVIGGFDIRIKILGK